MITTVQTGQASSLTFTAYSDGTQTDLGTVTIGIADAEGTEVVAPGTSVTDNANGTYEYILAAQSRVKFLIATWTVGSTVLRTYVDVIGSMLFDEASIRTFDDDAISSASYTDADILRAHFQAAQYMEEQTGRAYIRRYARAEFEGNNTRYLDMSLGHGVTSEGLALPRPGSGKDIVQIISIDGSASSASVFDGVLTNDSGFSSGSTYTVEWEYGMPYPIGISSRVGMLLAKHWLVASRIPSGADSFTDSLGSYGFNDSRLPFEAYNWLRQKSLVYF